MIPGYHEAYRMTWVYFGTETWVSDNTLPFTATPGSEPYPATPGSIPYPAAPGSKPSPATPGSKPYGTVPLPVTLYPLLSTGQSFVQKPHGLNPTPSCASTCNPVPVTGYRPTLHGGTLCPTWVYLYQRPLYCSSQFATPYFLCSFFPS